KLRVALLGSGSSSTLNTMTRSDVEQFFAKYFGTDRAFVVFDGDSTDLTVVSRRNSLAAAEVPGTEKSHRDPGAGDFHLESDLDEGAVIFGTPIPSVYYRNWYAYLMLDRLMQRVIPEKPRTELKPAIESYYYTMELSVGPAETTASVESTFQDELSR